MSALTVRPAVVVPELDIDAWFAKRGHIISARGRVERRVIAALIAHMAERGFQIYAVHDYEVETKVADAKAAMELVFNLDGCNLHFRDAAGKEHCVVIVLGNSGWDCISDWFISSEEFDQAMQAFDPEAFA